MRSKLFIVILLCCGLTQTSVCAQNPHAPFSGAKWITTPYSDSTGRRPCPVFLRSFTCRASVKKAELYITALGLYEAGLNGNRVGKALFTPGWTDYNKRIQYQRYDVTQRIKRGRNRLEVTIGEGWYRGTFRGAKPRDNYGSRAGLLALLLITYTNGKRQVIPSDASWQCASGPIRYSELYDGEFYDSIKGIYKEQPVELLGGVRTNLVPTATEPVTEHERFKPVTIQQLADSSLILDFGQNMAGYIEFDVQGHSGDTLSIAHAEMLGPDGGLFTGNLREAKATDIYTLNGSKQWLKPHFTYHGFRYARLQWKRNGKTMSPLNGKWNATAIAVYSNLKGSGSFACSDSLLNGLQRNIEWGLNSNFIDIPTDCPQRSERLGWCGDAQVFAQTACLLRYTKNFYAKWYRDLASEQGKNGGIPNYVPTASPYQECRDGAAGWGDAATILPWTLYQHYNDTRLLKEQYPTMKAWVDYIAKQAINGLWLDPGYGDWYASGPATKIGLIDQCYWAHSTDILIKAATVLGYHRDIAQYEKRLSAIKNAFLKAYVQSDRLKDETQTAYILALQFDLLPREMRDIMAARLAALIHENHDQLATGFLGTPYLLPVLSRFGYSSLAYTLLMQRNCPSWLYPLSKGATTIWEKWDAIKPDGTLQQVSFNHYAYGAVGQWFIENIAGIRAAAPGYRKIFIKPEIGGGLTWAKASYYCAYGVIRSSWQLRKKTLTLRVTIPRGTTAEVSLPTDNGTVQSHLFSSGTYILRSSLKSTITNYQ